MIIAEIIKIEEKKLINFASNDYLGLAGDKGLIGAAILDLPTPETYLAKLLNSYSHPQEIVTIFSELIWPTKLENHLLFQSEYSPNWLLTTSQILQSNRIAI